LAYEGYTVVTWKSPQVVAYNQAMAIYRDALANQNPYELSNAVTLFQQSASAYNRQEGESQVDRVLHGSPSSELLAQTYLHEGLADLIQYSAYQQKSYLDQAVKLLEQAIQVNPGMPYARDIAAGDIDRLAAESLPPKYDLELLFQQNPQEAQGHGQPKPGSGQGQKQGQGQGKKGSGNKSGSNSSTSKNPTNVNGHGSSSGI
jgi:tetratricopeptide (TPR) repeat protein